MLNADDYGGVLRVLETVERASSLSEFRRATLEALDEQFGYRHSVFLTGTTDEPKLEGIVHGYPQRRLDAHLARLSNHDVARRAAESERLSRTDTISLADVRDALAPPARELMDTFVHPLGINDAMAVWLQSPGTTVGLVGLLAGRDETLGPSERERMLVLEPHLANLLVHHLPRHVKVSALPLLTPREAETVDLVAAGHSNRAIAEHLNVTESTVKKHVSAALTKLDVSSRTQLTLAWLGGEASRRGRGRSRA